MRYYEAALSSVSFVACCQYCITLADNTTPRSTKYQVHRIIKIKYEFVEAVMFL